MPKYYVLNLHHSPSMHWIDEPLAELPCIMAATVDEEQTIDIKVDTIDEDTFKLPSGKKVPQLLFAGRDCSVCKKDEEHQVPFWAMVNLHEVLAEQDKRKGWVSVAWTRTVLPDGKNVAHFQLGDE